MTLSIDTVADRVGKVLTGLFGSRNERVLRELWGIVAAVNAREPEMRALSDDALRARTAVFRERLARGETLDDLLVEAFAALREAARRFHPQHQRHYDVQIIGGVVLHRGMIAEMATGEGKTLVATLPLYLNALSGRGCHLVTPNDYLSQVGGGWMGPVYHAMGLTTGVVCADFSGLYDPAYQSPRSTGDPRLDHWRPASRKEAYAADVTYGTNSEFGFDYLRDNMATHPDAQVQRGHVFAIVDEADSILIDEARTPLIISGPAEESTDKYYTADRVVRQLEPGVHFEVKEKDHAVVLTEAGIRRAEEILGLDNIYKGVAVDWPHHIDKALKAHHLYRRDKEYVVADGEVVIVDEFTGRLQHGRRWSDGQHQAVEAKEGLRIKRENQTLATVTIQNFFRLYEKLAGMTGTAATEADELHKIYKLDVVTIPTNRPNRRVDHEDVIYRTAKEKYDAIEEEIARVHQTGRPILVGTTSIEKSEMLSGRLARRGIRHEVLNAKHHAREAQIVAQAGQKGNVTIATNMAGRGTDILLGEGVVNAACLHPETRETWCCIRCNRPERDVAKGCPRCFKHAARRRGDYERCEKTIAASCPCGSGKRYDKCHYGDPQQPDYANIPCGLHIIGTERHEARRIDNQLRGRAARQGDPGSSRFYLSLEDDLMRIFAGDWVKGMMDRLGMKEGDVIESPMVSRGIARAQKRVEEHNFEIRKNLLEYDTVMDEQRKLVYGQRQKVLEGRELRETIWAWMEESVDLAIAHFLRPEAKGVEPNPDGFVAWINRKYDVGLPPAAAREESPEALRARILGTLQARYDAEETRVGTEAMRTRERFLLLLKIDVKWKEHLHAMDALRKGISLRSYGGVDPKIAYRKEGYELFDAMIDSLKDEVTELALRVEWAEEKVEERLARIWAGGGAAREADPEPSAAFARHAEGQAEAVAGSRKPHKPIVRAQPRVGRNDPCPCGSGKKYKKCHGA